MITEFSGQQSFLSNFFPCKIELEGIVFISVEHAFQAAKTEDHEIRLRIASMIRPGMAKRAGGSRGIIPDFDRSKWDDKKLQVMETVCRIKFEDQELRQKLIDTGHEELVEGNRWNDRFWGVCLKTQKGQNHLGKILMKIRSEIASQQ